MAGATLLIELLTEELPPKSLKRLSEAFAAEIAAGLKREALIGETSIVTPYATPRRLALRVSEVQAQAPDQSVEMKGPSVAVALDEQGQPKPALQGFAKKCGVAVEQLQRVNDGKAEYFAYRSTAKGAALSASVERLIAEAAKKLPVAKIMRWGGGEAQFVRPVQGLLVMHGDKLLAAQALDATSIRNATLGHRFLARTTPVTIASADSYEADLEQQGVVIADFQRRKARIARELNTKAQGAHIFMDDALLEEVTALTEWPVVYEGTFEAEYLSVPQECLILTMQQNQRYFPLGDANRKLTNRFLLVSNLETSDPSRIVQGNQRVLRARLADAKFFFEQDKKKPLIGRVEALGNVVYHNKLGSQLERVKRIHALAQELAKAIGANGELVDQAAYLCKADLLTDMVGEFPELQGTMGRYYANFFGYAPEVAQAIEQHYQPRFAGDTLPNGSVAVCVALADKLDTLLGIFGIGQTPTGDKDPFGLRRQALGVLRILGEKRVPLDLRAILNQARDQFAAQGKTLTGDAAEQVFSFMLDRLRNALREDGFAPDEIEAVVSQNPTRIDLVGERMRAVREFKRLPEAEALASANKRIQNILKKTAIAAHEADAALLREPAEHALLSSMHKLEPQVSAALAGGSYTQALTKLAGIRGDVDTFFDKVMVMTDDVKVRDNRLALLTQLGRLMNQVADISKLA